MKVINVPIKEDNKLLQVIYGEVYIPNVLDSHGEWMTHWEITAMAHGFMANGDLTAVDREHNNVKTGARIVESYIANEGDPIFIAGAWVIGVKLPDEMWELYLSGDINGFSFEGLVHKSTALYDVEIPFTMTGETAERDGHIHLFKVYFNESGDFLGGETSAPLAENGEILDGHYHLISRGTVTDDAEQHNHTFNFIDALVNDDDQPDNQET
ncbi:XkdF-like putative serine protease domain-containing protein (plasmid) [Halobacteriovorax sp. GFR7]|uniref:XkdF-like putative serine protease domain-containing protein n=1 Tax=unclassified Halobacteriovorax TaxID=2639665 RepID=UPI003D985877